MNSISVILERLIVETFGEIPFTPSYCKAAYHLTKKQEKLSVAYSNEAGQIVNATVVDYDEYDVICKL